ncbi:MAG TPA: hypothetical protein PKD86_09550, partial [Gemmatales bacterium]|nr:hypothetical protein [Gemmatales bacterium]
VGSIEPRNCRATVVSWSCSLATGDATFVAIHLRSAEKGQIVIHFENNGEFERVIDSLRRAA